MKKVLIAGTFDILHPGHINLIKQAKKLGDFLVVVIARDKNVIKAKGRSPYNNEGQRQKNLEELGLVDKVILGSLSDPYRNIKQEKPNIIALGYDQQVYVNGLQNMMVNSNVSAKIERLEPFKETVCKGKSIRSAVEDSQAGFLLVDKPEDWTSHDVVAKLRSIIGIKQIGHTGTLDPFATGLLICAVRKATKMVGMFDVMAKTYEAMVRLGVVSDTYDRTGVISNYQLTISNQDPISNSKLKDVIDIFVGKQKQIPPMYSAKKIGGKKLYELARQGKEVERKASEIEIYDIELISNSPASLSRRRGEQLTISNQDSISNFQIKVKCSTGSYIRSLAHDIGQKLGTGAILEELKRTAIGDFDVSQAVQLSGLSKENYSEYLVKPLEALEIINSYCIKKTP